MIATTGAVRVETLDEAVEAAEFLAHASAPSGGRIGVIVFSGGLKAIVADCADRAAAELATLAADTLATLSRWWGRAGRSAIRSISGRRSAGWFERYLECLRAFRRDPNVDVVLLQDELLRAPEVPTRKPCSAVSIEMIASRAGYPGRGVSR